MKSFGIIRHISYDISKIKLSLKSCLKLKVEFFQMIKLFCLLQKQSLKWADFFR